MEVAGSSCPLEDVDGFGPVQVPQVLCPDHGELGPGRQVVDHELGGGFG